MQEFLKFILFDFMVIWNFKSWSKPLLFMILAKFEFLDGNEIEENEISKIPA